MRPTRSRTLATALLVAGATAFGAQAATSSDNPIAAAVAPAPPALRDTATVLGWQEDGTMRVLRQGEGELTCLADNPADERFHVACYHNALEPFMARGRELRREGKEREELLRVREEEIASGKLEMPNGPTALYSLTGPADSFDSVITNPPFRLGGGFVIRSLKVARVGVALLVRTVFLESVGRYLKMFTSTPPTHFAQFTERVLMVKGRLDKKASTATGYCWLVWEKAAVASPKLMWIPPCRKALERPGDYDVPAPIAAQSHPRAHPRR